MQPENLRELKEVVRNEASRYEQEARWSAWEHLTKLKSWAWFLWFLSGLGMFVGGWIVSVPPMFLLGMSMLVISVVVAFGRVPEKEGIRNDDHHAGR